MRLVSYDDFVVGMLRGDEITDLTAAIGDVPSLPWDERVPAFIRSYSGSLATSKDQWNQQPALPLTSVRLRAPVPRPPKLLCAIGNFGAPPPPDSPLAVDFTFKSPESVIGPGDTIVLADVPASGFEAEATLAVVIGREARKLTTDEALSYVFGYTAFLDVFATGLGRPQVGTFFGKSLDTLGPMGPCLVTADELGDPQDLHIRFSVNDTTCQEFNTSEMLLSVADVLRVATEIMTLYPGDVVTCGSPSPGRAILKHDDRALVEIDRIGRLDVRVADPQRRSWPTTVS